MKKALVCLSVLAIFAAGLVAINTAQAADEEKPKFTIKEVMKAHKGGPKSLRAKVLAGKASEEEVKELVALYHALAKNTPKKGDKEVWAELTGKIVKAADGVAKGDKAAAKALAKATNCGGCHKMFK